MLKTRKQQAQITSIVFSVGTLLFLVTLVVSHYSGASLLSAVMISPGILISFAAYLVQIPWLMLWLTWVGDSRRTLHAAVLLLLHQVSAVIWVIQKWNQGQFWPLLPQESGWLPQIAFYTNAFAVVVFELWLWHLVLLPNKDAQQ